MMLKGIFSKSSIAADKTTINMINLTPYEGHLETVCRKWKQRDPQSEYQFKTLSITKSNMIAEYVEKTLALDLLQDHWAGSNKMLLSQIQYIRISLA